MPIKIWPGGAPPVAAPRVDPDVDARRAFETIARELSALDFGARFELADAVTDGRDWSELEDWHRDLFRRVAARLR